MEQLVLPLLATMAARTNERTDARFVRRIYAETLKHQPAFAIAMACRDFLEGQCGDGKWRPEVGEIFQRAGFHAKSYRDELARIREILAVAAPSTLRIELTEDERLARAATLHTLSAEIANNAAVAPKGSTAIQTYADVPVTVSAELVANLNKGRGGKAEK